MQILLAGGEKGLGGGGHREKRELPNKLFANLKGNGYIWKFKTVCINECGCSGSVSQTPGVT